MRCLVALFMATALVAAAAAQSGHLVGEKDVAWANPSGLGTRDLYTRVMYPSPTGGVDAPIEASPSGWPVVVFLHGFGMLGRDYVHLGRAWASQGFAVVLVDSAQFSFFDEAHDGRAQYAAIQAANADPASFFHGAFDTHRLAIAGHSMGGGAMALVLADNPGYRCGFAIASVFPGEAYTGRVDVPVGLVVGGGDQVTPSFLHAQPYFAAASPRLGLKFLYELDRSCDHMDVAGLAGRTDPAFVRTAAIGVGFFRHFLGIDAGALEQCIGPAALREPLLASLVLEVAQPRLWADAPLTPGATVRVSLAAEAGVGSILAAPSAGWATPTMVGTLLLDPAGTFLWTMGVAQAERRLDALLTVPNNPNLVGVRIAMQGLGATTSAPVLLGSAVEFVVQ